jgi:hypothetical protein
MTRETGLSPRRAPKLSRLPLSPRRTQVRLRPLLFLRPHPPKGGTPRERNASLPLPSEHPVLTLAYAQPACSRDSSSSHGAVRSARVPSCGLKRLRPGLAGSPRFKSSDPSSLPLAALALRPLCAVSTGKLEFPVWKEKLQCKPIFLSTPESIRFLERNTRWPIRLGG